MTILHRIQRDIPSHRVAQKPAGIIVILNIFCASVGVESDTESTQSVFRSINAFIANCAPTNDAAQLAAWRGSFVARPIKAAVISKPVRRVNGCKSPPTVESATNTAVRPRRREPCAPFLSIQRMNAP